MDLRRLGRTSSGSPARRDGNEDTSEKRNFDKAPLRETNLAARTSTIRREGPEPQSEQHDWSEHQPSIEAYLLSGPGWAQE